MDFNDYQIATNRTNMYTKAIDDLLKPLKDLVVADAIDADVYETEAEKAFLMVQDILNLAYVLLGYSGEVAELNNKFKKVIRGDKNMLDFYQEALYEQGDALWYSAQLVNQIGIYTLDDVAKVNLNKLQDREDRKVLKGSGDYR